MSRSNRGPWWMAVLLACASAAWAGPGTMLYQGRLLQPDSQPVVTTVTMSFTFWSAETGGTQLGGTWSDTDDVRPDAEGYYAAEIGDAPELPIPASVFAGANVFANVQINGEDLTPRMRVGEAGFAVTSERVHGAETGRISMVAGEELQAGDIVCINDMGLAVPARLAGYATLAVPRSIMTRPESILLGPNRVLTCSSNRATLSLINGEQITQGGVAAIGSWPTVEPPQVIALDANHALVMYTGQGRTYHRTLRVLTAAGMQLTMGPEVAIDVPNNVDAPYLIRVSATRALVLAPCTRVSGDHTPRYQVLNIAGTTITPGTSRIWHAPYEFIRGGVGIGDDERVLLFRGQGVADNQSEALTAELTQVGADEITLLSSVSVERALRGIRCGMLSSSTAVICGKQDDTHGFVQLLTLNSNTIIPHPATATALDRYATVALSLMPPDRFTVADGMGASLRFGQVTGTTITMEESIAFSGYEGLPYSSLVMLAADKVFVTYAYTKDGVVTHEQRLVKPTDPRDHGFDRRVGVAEQSASSGQPCLVTSPGGITEQFAGLKPGSRYFVQERGPRLSSGGAPIGLAISPTRMLIER